MSEDFRAHLSSAGYQTADAFLFDGRIRRIRWASGDGRKSRDGTGWYIGWTHNDLQYAVWGDWRDRITEKWSNKAERKWTIAEREEFKKRREEAEEKAEQERLLAASDAAGRAVRLLAASSFVTDLPTLPPYCQKKRISGERLRTLRGRIIVPLHDESRTLVNLQIIEADGTKRFLKSAAVVGASWMTGPLPPADWAGDIVVAEGVATAATVRDLSGSTVFAAMNSGNLPKVAESLRRRWPAARILIAADDDRWEKNGDARLPDKNAGQVKALEAANLCHGLVITPKFANAASRGTDWNDLYCEEGDDQARLKWRQAVAVAALDRRITVMGERDFQRQRESLLAAYAAAGIPKVGIRQLESLRKALRGEAAEAAPELDDSPVSILLRIVGDVEVWQDQLGTPMATLTDHHGVVVHVRIEGKAFEDWLRMGWDVEAYGSVPPRETVKNVVEQIASRARTFGKIHHTNIRFAHIGDALFLDLGRPDGHAVKITKEGWAEVESAPEARFVRNDNDWLPSPVRGGSMNDLWECLNIGEKDRVLVAGWLIASAIFPVAPPFLLNLCGSQGSAKTSTSKMIRRCFDPSKIHGQKINEVNLKDLSLTCMAQSIVLFENVSYLSEDAQDALCRIITGESELNRKLYTNEELVRRSFRRPVIINGINPVTTRADLAERSIVISLPEVSKGVRVTEEEVYSKFDELHPRILGALLDALVHAMKWRQHTRMQMKLMGISHRMADAAEWATAAEEAMGFPFGTFVSTLEGHQSAAGAEALEGHPCLNVISELVDENSRGVCRISMHELTAKVVATDAHRTQKGIPVTSRMMAAWLQREKKRLLESFGIDIGEPERARVNGQSVRMREFRRIGVNGSNGVDQFEHEDFLQ